jgi:hypothetical protein
VLKDSAILNAPATYLLLKPRFLVIGLLLLRPWYMEGDIRVGVYWKVDLESVGWLGLLPLLLHRGA